MQPPESGKAIIFGQMLNFSSRSQQDEVPEIRDFYWVGELGEKILPVNVAVFCALSKIFFGQKWLSPLEKIGPYAICADYDCKCWRVNLSVSVCGPK